MKIVFFVGQLWKNTRCMIVYKSRSLKGFCNNDWQCFTYNFTVIFDSDNNARQCLQYYSIFTWSGVWACMESFQRMVRIWWLVTLLQISISRRENACCWESSSILITISRSLVNRRWTLTSESVMSRKSASTIDQSVALGREVRNLLQNCK